MSGSSEDGGDKKRKENGGEIKGKWCGWGFST